MEHEAYNHPTFEMPLYVINNPYRVAQSFAGRYFIGHTPILTLRRRLNAWGGLLNDAGSGVDIFLNTFTVSNIGDVPIRAELWLNATPPGKPSYSESVSAANTAITPVPQPSATLAYAQQLPYVPAKGVSLFSRIVGASSTEVGNYYGKIVVPPGSDVIVFLHAPSDRTVKAEIALGWWENTV